jgi:hypothetical protein
VFWGLACVLLIVLWVRSYHWVEVVVMPAFANCSIELGNTRGTFGIGITTAQPPQFIQQHADELTQSGDARDPREPSPIWGKFVSTAEESILFVPAWFLVSLVAATTALPWRPWRWRFSLRTLLIATTLVAVVLGLAVWAANR